MHPSSHTYYDNGKNKIDFACVQTRFDARNLWKQVYFTLCTDYSVCKLDTAEYSYCHARRRVLSRSMKY